MLLILIWTVWRSVVWGLLKTVAGEGFRKHIPISQRVKLQMGLFRMSSCRVITLSGLLGSSGVLYAMNEDWYKGTMESYWCVLCMYVLNCWSVNRLTWWCWWWWLYIYCAISFCCDSLDVKHSGLINIHPHNLFQCVGPMIEATPPPPPARPCRPSLDGWVDP